MPIKLISILFFALIFTGCQRFLVLDSTTDQPIVGASAQILKTGIAPGFGHPTEFALLNREYQTDSQGEFSVLSPWAKDAYVSLSKEGYDQINTAKELKRNQDKGASVIYLYMTPKSDVTIETIYFSVALGEKLVADKSELFGYSRIATDYRRAKKIAKSQNELAAVRLFCRFVPGIKSHIENNPRYRLLGEELEAAQELLRDCQGMQ